MPSLTKPERQLRKVKGKWTDASSDAVVAAGETMIADLHRAKMLDQMDDNDPVIRAAKAKR